MEIKQCISSFIVLPLVASYACTTTTVRCVYLLHVLAYQVGLSANLTSHVFLALDCFALMFFYLSLCGILVLNAGTLRSFGTAIYSHLGSNLIQRTLYLPTYQNKVAKISEEHLQGTLKETWHLSVLLLMSIAEFLN